jgi:uncharacterized membrane protein (Fun14 family)
VRRWFPLLATAALAAALVSAPDAMAHAIVGREDLPIPRWLFGWAATAVLVVSFVALAVLWPAPRLERSRERDVLTYPRWLEVLCGAIGVALFALVVWAGLAGSQSVNANFAPRFVLVLFWVGVPVLSVLLGDVFRPFNPWRAIGRAAGWVAKRIGGDSLPEALPYPARLGRWPAAAGLFLFATYELVYANSSQPDNVAIASLIYAALQLVGMATYGVEAWSRNGDGLGVYFGLFAEIAPLRWHDGKLSVRPMFSGLTKIAVPHGTVGLLAVAIGTTTFDGMSENEFWTDTALDIQGVLEDVGIGATRGLEIAYLLGMAGVVLIAGLLFMLGVRGMRTVDNRISTNDLARHFVHSLVPIAFAYVLAHYFSLLVYEGQAGVFLASDPLGRGWNILGMAQNTVDYTVVSANAIWYVQVGALVIGHVAGLVLAHDRALMVFRDVKRATRSQYWMLAVMVAFTSLGLWLLSSSNA